MSLTSYRAAPSRGDFALIMFWSGWDRLERYDFVVFSRFGGDLLSHVSRRSTIGATALNDRVRNGAGCFARAMTTKPKKDHNAACCGVFGLVSGRQRFTEGDNAFPHLSMPGAAFINLPFWAVLSVSSTLYVCMLLSVRSQVCVPVCYWIKSSLSDH